MTTDNKLADALHILLAACDESDSAMYGTLGVSFVRDVAQAALAEHDAKPPANGEAELPPLPRRWYVGALNDGKFIVDTPPSPCGTDIPPDWGTPPELVLNVVALSLEQAREICDAHNAAIAALQQRVTPLALPELMEEDVVVANRILYSDEARTAPANTRPSEDEWDLIAMRAALESYRASLMAKGVPNG